MNKQKLLFFLLIAGLLLNNPLFAKRNNSSVTVNNNNITALISQLKQLEQYMERVKKMKEYQQRKKKKHTIADEIQKVENEANLLQQKILLLTEQNQYTQNLDSLKPSLRKILKDLYQVGIEINNFTTDDREVFVPYTLTEKIGDNTFYLVKKSDLQKIYTLGKQKERNEKIIRGIYLMSLAQDSINGLSNGISQLSNYIYNTVLNINNSAAVDNSPTITENGTVFLNLKQLKKNCSFEINSAIKEIIFKRCQF